MVHGLKYLNKIVLLLLLINGYASNAFSQTDINNQLKYAQSLSKLHPDSALIILKQIHAKASSANNLITAGLSFQYMGQICFDQGHYAQALDFYLHADKLFTKTGNKDMLADNWSKMGILYYYNKQHKQAQAIFSKAHHIYQYTHNVKGQAQVLGELGHLFEKQRRYDSAFYYQTLALKRYEQIQAKHGIAKIYENIGSIYEDLAKYDSAYTCFSKSKDLYDQEHDLVSSIEVINNLGDILRKTGRYTESIVQSGKAYQLAAKTRNVYQLATASRDLGKSYQLLGKMDSAYRYVELSRKYSLDIYSADGLKQTAFLQVLYDFDKKSNEISRLNTIRKTNRIIITAVVVIAILVIVLAVLLYSRQRFKIREQKILAEQNQSRFESQRELMELELKNNQLEEENLKQQLELRNKELSDHTLNLIKNNQLLEGMRNTLQQMVKDDKRDQKKQMQQIVDQINQSFNHEQHWNKFNTAFEQVHGQVFEKLKPNINDLTATDVRLIALMKVNMESKDIAGLMGVSMDSLRVSRHRLRKKLNIDQSENLFEFIQSL